MEAVFRNLLIFIINNGFTVSINQLNPLEVILYFGSNYRCPHLIPAIPVSLLLSPFRAVVRRVVSKIDSIKVSSIFTKCLTLLS